MSIEDLARHGEQIEKLVEELTALRAWKAKARPFLEAQRQTNQAILNEANYNCVEDELEQEIKTLTELLGGKDEQDTRNIY